MQEQHASKPKDPLDYPFETVPPRGTTLELAPGVHWIRMPLPYALDHINLWELDDDAGWAIVYTGTRTDENARYGASSLPMHQTSAASPASLSPTCTPTTWAWPAG